MTEQHFTVVLKGADPLVNDVVERIYARCDDASAGTCNGIGHVHFDRPAESLNTAIASAIADLRACGLDVDRIEIGRDALDELVAGSLS